MILSCPPQFGQCSETASRNNLPIDRITAVNVLDPYFYRS